MTDKSATSSNLTLIDYPTFDMAFDVMPVSTPYTIAAMSGDVVTTWLRALVCRLASEDMREIAIFR